MSELNEKDYLNVASIQNEIELLDNHWRKCSLNKTWTTVEGEVYTFSELSNSHLNAIIKMLFRFYILRNSKNLLNLIYDLYIELEKRFINKKGSRFGTTK